jgi:hypothetical protein
MALAKAPSKLSVPVDLHYQFDNAVQTGRPATLHLAAVPRIAATNLQVSVKQVAGLQVAAPALAVQKATASTAYRQQLSVTRLAGGPAEVRVLVTMDLPEGAAFGWFSVPFEAAVARKQQAPLE